AIGHDQTARHSGRTRQCLGEPEHLVEIGRDESPVQTTRRTLVGIAVCDNRRHLVFCGLEMNPRGKGVQRTRHRTVTEESLVHTTDCALGRTVIGTTMKTIRKLFRGL
ncbi:MAG: hypothetical protein RLZ37_1327, partial [Actinomycetota bacterium]